ncbi:hypothetical protein [Shimia sp.]|uniref:hypothetical protein n=1 Tax=Shimia sp. TaxID=1954381 RepID=UPI003B8AA68A
MAFFEFIKWTGRLLPILFTIQFIFFTSLDLADGRADDFTFICLSAILAVVLCSEVFFLGSQTKSKFRCHSNLRAFFFAALLVYPILVLLFLAVLLILVLGVSGEIGISEQASDFVVAGLFLYIVKQTFHELLRHNLPKIENLSLPEPSKTEHVVDTKFFGEGHPNAYLNAIAKKRTYSLISIERRSRSLKRRALFILYLIVLLIGGGIFISIFVAGDVVTSEGTSVNRLSEVRQLIGDYETEIAESNELILRLIAERQDEVTKLVSYGLNSNRTDAGLHSFDIEGDCEIVNSSKASETESKSSQSTSTDATKGKCAAIRDVGTSLAEYERLSRQIGQLEKRVTRRSETVEEIEKAVSTDIKSFLPSSVEPETDVELLIASGLTRFGILFVVIYLVQILVGIYRYSQRLAAHYDMLADALANAPNNSNNLGQWKDDLSPVGIEFGKSPVSPSQHVVDSIKALLARKDKSTGEQPS